MKRNIILLVGLIVLCPIIAKSQGDSRFENDSILFTNLLNELQIYQIDLMDDDSALISNPMNFNKVNRHKRHVKNIYDLELKRDTLTAHQDTVTIIKKRDIRKVERVNRRVENNIIDTLNSSIYAIVDSKYNRLIAVLFNYERDKNEYSFDNLTAFSIGMIQHIDDINDLKWMYHSVEEYWMRENSNDLTIRKKLLIGISKQMNLVAANQLAWYTYYSTEKRILRGIVINSANDLLTPMGIGLEKVIPNGSVFQKNNDMDYTGNIKIGLVTDYLRIQRNRPVKSFQTIFFGADIYTPYYRLDSIFINDTSYNKYDIPHSSFQYIGLETNAISRGYTFRWRLAIKLGKIGGKKADDLQTALHQDLTFSPRPQGWGAQIANKGRFSYSLEYKPELMLRWKNADKRETRFMAFYPSLFGDLSLGHYQTYIGGGFQISNRNFFSSNPYFMEVRNKIGNNGLFHFKYVSFVLNFGFKYMIHNTMLEGFGVFNTDEGKDDNLAPKSIHKFDSKEVRKMHYQYNFIISKQAKRFSVFYRHSIRSPLLKPIKDPKTGENYFFRDNKGNKIKLYTRWHHYGTVGVILKIG